MSAPPAKQREIHIVFGVLPPEEERALLETAANCDMKLIPLDSLSPALARHGRRDVHFGRCPRILGLDGKTVIFGTNPIVRYFSDVSSSSRGNSSSPPSHSRNPAGLLTTIFREACAGAFHEFDLSEIKIEVMPSDFGKVDYQFNGAMALYTKLKGQPGFQPKSPQETAKAIVKQIDPSRYAWLCESIATSGNTFYINVVLARTALEGHVSTLVREGRVPPLAAPKRERILVDFSSPNIAKEMHVGHLRSTIIGETICRLFEYTGNEVLRANHLGDWGTQFGMLLQYLKEDSERNGNRDTLAYLDGMTLSDLTQLYKLSKAAYGELQGKETDPVKLAFQEKAKRMVVALQSGTDPHARAVWEKLRDVSYRGFEEIYRLLNVSFPVARDLATGEPIPGTGYCGESFYQDKIDSVISELDAAKLTTRSPDGAVLLFTGMEEAKTREKDEATGEVREGEIPLVLRKNDGGFGYDSTDVTALRYRLKNVRADRVIYVTDMGQALHFSLVFEAGRLAKWFAAGQRADHVKFGLVNKEDGGKMKTREGDSAKLIDLLNDAKEVMRNIVLERAAKEAEALQQGEKRTRKAVEIADLDTFATKLGCSAVKFSDLSRSREKSYTFDREAMMKTDSSSAIYPLYQYARICSVIAKAPPSAAAEVLANLEYSLEGASLKERAVALRVLRFPESILAALETLSPHVLCHYLQLLSVETASFYMDDAERILDLGAAGSEPRFESKRGAHRFLLVNAVKVVLKEGLGLLAIEPEEKM